MVFGSAKSAVGETLENAKGLIEKSKEKADEVKRIVKADQKGWLVCLAVLIITVVRSGIPYSFGAIIVNIKDEFAGVSMTELNYIGTLSFCISLSCAPLSVSLIRAFGSRGFRIVGLIGTAILTISCFGSSFVQTPTWLFLTHSLLYGVGSSLIYMSSSLVIGDYFQKDHKYHVLATSILLCGYPIGSLVFNPINAWISSNYAYRGVFRCSAVLILISGVSCCWNFSARESVVMQKLDDDPETTDDEERSSLAGDSSAAAEGGFAAARRCCTWAEISRRPEIVLWYIGNCLSYLGFYMPFVNLESYLKEKNITVMDSSIVLTLLSLAECITYIIASFLGDYLKDHLVYVNVISSSCLALICMIWPLIDISYFPILAVSIVMGGFLGLNIVYTYAASGEVTKLPIDIAWSCTNLWSGIGILLGPFCSGKVYDITLSFADVFYAIGGVYILATLAFGAIPLLQRRREMLYGDETQNEMNGATRFETFRISTKRSTSKSSLQIPASVGNAGAMSSTAGAPGPTPAVNGFDSTGYSESTAALASAYGAIAAGPGAFAQQQQPGGRMQITDMQGTTLINRGGMAQAGMGMTSGTPPYHSINYD